MDRNEFNDLGIRFQKLLDRVNEEITKKLNYHEVANDVAKQRIVLSEDPVSEGLSSLNKKIAEVQAAKEFVSGSLMRVLAKRSTWEGLAKAGEQLYSDKQRRIIRESEAIQNLKSEGLRIATADAQCTDEIWLNAQIAEEVNQIDICFRICKERAEILSSANENLKEQTKTISYMINIGEIERKSLTGYDQGVK